MNPHDTPTKRGLRQTIIDTLDEYALQCLDDVDRDPAIQADAMLTLFEHEASRRETAAEIRVLEDMNIAISHECHKRIDARFAALTKASEERG